MKDAVNEKFLHWLNQVCGARVVEAEMIQPLWSGFGACFRAKLNRSHDIAITNSKQANKQNEHHIKDQPSHVNIPKEEPWEDNTARVVVKCASPPNTLSHPKGWNGEASHKRKCRSFRVENHFYSAMQLQTNEKCRTAKYLTHDENGEASLLVMEDLAHSGYSRTATSLTVESAKTVLTWLAYFHACFLTVKREIDGQDTTLWREGTYWHLGTREDEFKAMPSGPLKLNARTIAKRLSDAHYQTLVHGDAKVANFCFSQDFASCAAVDFQYVGYGVGVKDVAYFLGSALTTEQHIAHRDLLLDCYFNVLEEALCVRLYQSKHTCPFDDDDIKHVVEQWRGLYAFACADFYRFLAGWSPEHWKIDTELQYQTDIALAALAASG